jgi:fructose-1,6-bisphosphatase class II
MKNIVEKMYSPSQEMINSKLYVGILKATKAAAKACHAWIGKGDEKAADQAAVNAMRAALNELEIDGTIAIGEGERDEAPMLYIGEKVGKGGVAVDIALDPLEGTTLCAHNSPNSISVIAIANRGGFLHAPDTYMEKIAVGARLPQNIISLENTPEQNLKNVAEAKGCNISDLTVCILNRPRHDELISKVRKAGARIKLIKDGDVMGAIATALPNTGVDVYMGIGGAPEGVLAAAALKALKGQLQARLIFKDKVEELRAKQMGIVSPDKIYNIEDMVRGDVIFVATGVTDGEFLEGIKFIDEERNTYHSLVISSIDNILSYKKTCEL